MTSSIHGFGIPFRIDPFTGRVASADGDDKLRENVVHIVMTSAGERPMMRDYGGGLRRLLHDPNNDPLRAIVQHQIGKAVSTYEPRVQVNGVYVEQDDATLYVTVQYTVLRTQSVQTVSVPIGVQ